MKIGTSMGQTCAAIVLLGGFAASNVQATTPPVVDKATFVLLTGNPKPVSLEIYGKNFGSNRPIVATSAHSVVTALISHTTEFPPAMRNCSASESAS